MNETLDKTELRTVDDFIAFFTKIPDDRWTRFNFITGQGKCCAMGHLGTRNDHMVPDEANAFQELLRAHFGRYVVIAINDETDDCPEQFKGIKTPKARILAALHEIKSHQEKE